MNNLLVVIPAIKKNALIPDQLVKKLNGITLIQRAINTAKKIVPNENIFIITDSEEISLISERNNIPYKYDKKLSINSENLINTIKKMTSFINKENVLVYRANAPLVNENILLKAYKTFLENKDTILLSVKTENKTPLRLVDNSLKELSIKPYYEEIKAFLIFNKNYLNEQVLNYKPFIVDDVKSIEIDGYQNWWVCEKILQRKRIVFNVIGNTKIGMGHIYHSLTLAHEITDHEVIFVCDQTYKLAVDKIASTDYQVIATDDVTKTIISLNPDIVINDTLNTKSTYIQDLKKEHIKVVNFEDLGEGSKYADIVFNELYDIPQRKGNNYIWGHEYLALRNEFDDAVPNLFKDSVNAILISFGGTDQNNLTLLSLQSILDICIKKNIHIYIVCGGGYLFKQELESFITQSKYTHIELTYAIGVISKIMEKTQIAISSNGRTVYELADMNIPSIVISHHEREATHTFASLEKGFINLGIVNSSTNQQINKIFTKLITDNDYRKLLYMNIVKFNFRNNKQKVVNKIMDLLNEE